MTLNLLELREKLKKVDVELTHWAVIIMPNGHFFGNSLSISTISKKSEIRR